MKTYLIPCEGLGLVLKIKAFNLDEVNTVHSKLVERFYGSEKHLQVRSYIELLIKLMLIAPDKTLDSVGEEDFDIKVEVYKAIIRLYPSLDIVNICNVANERVFHGLNGDVPIEELEETPLMKLTTLSDIAKLEKYLKGKILGQDEAISTLINKTKLLTTGIKDRASFLFVGATGVGKTELARLFAKKYGKGNFYRINCSEFVHGHETNKLIGSPPGYFGSESKSILCEKSEKSNSWTFVFDEVEKADRKLLDIILCLVDEGLITDNSGKELDFTKSNFIFTSNLGFSKAEKCGFGEKDAKTVIGDIEKALSPEFINRIDDIIVFNQLAPEVIEKIAKQKLKKYPIKATKDLVAYVAKEGYSDKYGVRYLEKTIEKLVGVPVAEEILEEKVPREGDQYILQLCEGALIVQDTVHHSEV